MKQYFFFFFFSRGVSVNTHYIVLYATIVFFALFFFPSICLVFSLPLSQRKAFFPFSHSLEIYNSVFKRCEK